MDFRDKKLLSFSLLFLAVISCTPVLFGADQSVDARRRVARLCRQISPKACSAKTQRLAPVETTNVRLLAIGAEYLKNFNPLNPVEAKDRAYFQELFTMLASVPCEAGTQETPKHVRDLYRDLSIFYDPAHPRSSLVDIISRCHTRSGLANLAERLANSITDIKSLKRQQKIVQTLKDNNDLQTTIDEHLGVLAEHENAWFNHDSVISYDWLKKLIVFPLLFKYPTISDAWVLYANYLTASGIFMFGKTTLDTLTSNATEREEYILTITSTIPEGSIHIVGSLSGAKKDFAYLVMVQAALIRIAHYLKSAKYLHQVVKSAPDLAAYIDTPHLDEFFDKSKPLPPDVQQFFTQIKSRTFRGEPSYLSRFGNVLSTAYYFLKTKSYFAGIIKEIGLIDSYLSCAKLMQEQPEKWCFPTYIEANSPQINFKNMWHPKLTPNEAVSSSITLGGNGNSKNALVLGANGGGKSTTTQATLLVLWLGETLGFTPAEAASFTPFATLATFAAVPDDVISGQSKFNAEAAKTRQICQLAKNAATRGFVFFFLDEIITGTDPEHSEAIVYALTKRLGLSDNVMFTLCTHHHGLSELGAEDPDRFGLFTVPSTVGADGKIHHSYILTPGPYDEQGTQFATLLAQDVPQSLIKIAQQRHISMRSRL